MPQINLLPWREELKARRQKEFGILAGVTFLIMAAVVVGVHVQFQTMVDHQNRRNAFLEKEIVLLNDKIKKIKDLDQEKRNLLDRMTIIQQLQSSRAEIVHMVDELVNRIPDGVYFTSIKQNGPNLVIMGVAQSNARVSSLMRNLDSSEYLTNPKLNEIKVNPQTSRDQLRLADFTLGISQRKLTKESSGDGGGEKSKKSRKKRG